MVQEKQNEQLEEMIVEIELSRLRDFKNHPFKVKADSQMIELIDSIGQLVIMPVVIPEFTFESWDERGTKAFGSTGR